MKFRILAIAIITFVVGALSALLPTSSASASSGAFVSDINGLRASKGLAPLAVNGSLSGFAQSWAEKMAAAGSISHNPKLGSAPGSWTNIGENVGVGSSEKTIFNALVASPGHYANMVNGKFNSVGVGIATGKDGRIYTTHNFAAYPGAGASSSGNAGGSKSSGSAKPAAPAAKPAKAPVTAAPKAAASTPAATTAPTVNDAIAAAAPASSAAPVAPANTDAPTAPASSLPLPSERIVQGLVEVGSIGTQG